MKHNVTIGEAEISSEEKLEVFVESAYDAGGEVLPSAFLASIVYETKS
ncbi:MULTISPECIES: hypothetical protein [Brevibacillus]|jgi:hypothetical protein|nr:hypothetical protein [Brevibacillus borstelensis]MBE5394017.1 hypothetical protein [Brevibacillus borstelensis]MCC0564149.1 hypothetical protein [Brevibacillus borstelensis]MCM3470733.1 hypothetical protein [Brevibacillus borstelensis]MCM3558925.1 hypothetical protein [Brevibacillus borstelensis]MCM3593411.1 hypothetical protein [Brevibacillus borstelensis]